MARPKPRPTISIMAKSIIRRITHHFSYHLEGGGVFICSEKGSMSQNKLLKGVFSDLCHYYTLDHQFHQSHFYSHLSLFSSALRYQLQGNTIKQPEREQQQRAQEKN